MKDLIGIAILIVTLFGGTKMLRVIYTEVQRAALTKTSQGLPPLPQIQGK
jgi:hypothetical protein